MNSFPNTHLTVGESDPFLPKLLQAINYATSVSIAAAFIRQTGLNLIFDALDDALLRGAKVRILTGDYMGITEPRALRNLMLLQSRGGEVKVFESKGYKSFHMKAYIFIENSNIEQIEGVAFVGSSNISKSALKDGLEWNLAVDNISAPEKFNVVVKRFEQLYCDYRCARLDHVWIDAYEKRIPKLSEVKLLVDNEADDFEPLLQPNQIQSQALTALHQSRQSGYKRGLVVMATGTGKTWLSAFDSKNMDATKILFVAHREEILDQAEKTFIKMFPNARLGRYSGVTKNSEVDILFASIQTLGKQLHLQDFSPRQFDYIVIDEFHHAAANSYQKLLAYFTPAFMLGLTATPERTDQSDILSLCDDNLVFSFGLFEGIESDVLSPFDYKGIADTVDYSELAWRNNKFDPQQLENKLATISRAKHNYTNWQEYKQKRTLAFCVSTKHADFMADYFNRRGAKALSVHSRSKTPRNAALQALAHGSVDIIFSVDLFNEGVDLPSIDTVLMLRPTDSKIIFLQQLGRGLRKSDSTFKDKLIILDFIGNHISFFRKVESLFRFGLTNAARKSFLQNLKNKSLPLPKGCFVNINLQAINILEQLVFSNIDKQVDVYQGLRDSLGRRPTLSEFYYAGGAVETLRKEHGNWFRFMESQQDLSTQESLILRRHIVFLTEIETTSLTKSFKLVLLEAFLELNGLAKPLGLAQLAERSIEVLNRRPALLTDLPADIRKSLVYKQLDSAKWLAYWNKNPVNAWVGGNRKKADVFFEVNQGLFQTKFDVSNQKNNDFADMVQELVNYRFIQYESRLANRKGDAIHDTPTQNVFQLNKNHTLAIPFFADLKIACGHFKSSSHEQPVLIEIPETYGRLDAKKHFVAIASGNSMNGGQRPILEGDLLLFERISSANGGIASLNGKTVAIERYDITGDDQYLLRTVKKLAHQQYELVAQNPEYQPMVTDSDMHPLATLKSTIDPADVYTHQEFMRSEIPPLFGLEFTKAIWEAGHIRVKQRSDQFLLVTLNKQGKNIEHQYHDSFDSNTQFQWQSQAKTKLTSAKGKAILHHENVHLFVRKNKLLKGKAAPFYYLGKVNYQSHTGETPISVTWELITPIPDSLLEYFKV